MKVYISGKIGEDEISEATRNKFLNAAKVLAAEKAAAEKAAAEKAGAIVWELSERERKIVEQLNKAQEL